MRIRTYHCNSIIKASNVFYVLSKGLNAGRPMYSPCPNCFVVESKSKIESDMLFSYIYILFKTGKFRYSLCGSVIPFLRIIDFKQLLDKVIMMNDIEHSLSIELLKNVNLINTQKENLKNQLSLLNQIELSYIKKHVKV